MNCATRIMADGPLVAVLAAGLGSRFGGGKLDADCAGKPLGQWALDAAVAAGLVAGVIVTGAEPPGFARASGWRLLVNPAPEVGLGGSVAIAAAAALAQGRDLLLLLADMPLVAPDFLASLAAHPAAATRHPDGAAGVPALLPLAILAQVSRLEGERGARKLLAGMAGLTLLDPPPGMLRDVDYRADLVALAEALSGRG